MSKCPVCNSISTSIPCPDCGFDISRDYEHYPTLCSLSGTSQTIVTLRKSHEEKVKDFLCCTQCGSRHFFYKLSAQHLICTDCGTAAPVQITQKPQAPQAASDLVQLLSKIQRNKEQGPLAIPPEGCTVLSAGSNAWNRSNVSGWTNIKAIATGAWYTVGLKIDNTVIVSCDNKYGFPLRDLHEVKSVAIDNSSILALRHDGTVWSTSVVGNKQGKVQKWVSAWNDIDAISTGFFHTAALRKNGTVAAVGGNFDGQCKVEPWSNIISVTCGYYHTVGLRKDGTVLAVGRQDKGQCDVSSWHDITAIAAGESHTVGLHKDGTVVACGNNVNGQCKVNSWCDIVAITSGSNKTLGLRKDGTVISTDPNDPVHSWKRIAAIATSGGHTVGLQLPE